jgi:hypothetical protein
MTQFKATIAQLTAEQSPSSDPSPFQEEATDGPAEFQAEPHFVIALALMENYLLSRQFTKDPFQVISTIKLHDCSYSWRIKTSSYTPDHMAARNPEVRLYS